MPKRAFDRKMDNDILHVLNEVEDPELGIGIVDVGLIYRAEWTATGIEVDVTTTVPSCPFADSLREQVETVLRKQFSETSSIQVQLVFDPPWALERLSKNARQSLGWTGASDVSPETFVLHCWNTVNLRKH